ncbi:TPA: helix-turn-helix domain-containing protein [Vibrio parahaemolyticus]|nr:helix-turn-helix domain-containing protein [Vibrio parahaemolyticus]HCH0786627.1 helix-turn-helix domain-containing protein [Vibrio parahaemolyticus]
MTTSLTSNSKDKAKHFNFHKEILEKFELDTKASFVLFILCSRANKNNQTWPSYSRLAQITCLNRKSVMRAVKALEEKGIIKVFRRRTDSQKNETNIFTLNIEQLDEEENVELDSPLQGPLIECGEEAIADGSLSGPTLVPNRDHPSPYESPEYKDEYKEDIKVLTRDVIPRITPSESMLVSIKDDVLCVWNYIKSFVKHNKGSALSDTPSERDQLAIQWAIDAFLIDPNSREECLKLCSFTYHELGEQGALLNPYVRLHQAYLGHGDINRFIHRWEYFCSDIYPII